MPRFMEAAISVTMAECTPTRFPGKAAAIRLALPYLRWRWSRSSATSTRVRSYKLQVAGLGGTERRIEVSDRFANQLVTRIAAGLYLPRLRPNASVSHDSLEPLIARDRVYGLNHFAILVFSD